MSSQHRHSNEHDRLINEAISRANVLRDNFLMEPWNDEILKAEPWYQEYVQDFFVCNFQTPEDDAIVFLSDFFVDWDTFMRLTASSLSCAPSLLPADPSEHPRMEIMFAGSDTPTTLFDVADFNEDELLDTLDLCFREHVCVQHLIDADPVRAYQVKADRERRLMEWNRHVMEIAHPDVADLVIPMNSDY